MHNLLTDPWFYAAALPAVILVGLSKGGFGGAVGFVGVPLMALVMSPVQAAAILLPILCLMDIVSLWTWRGVYDGKVLRSMMPGAHARHRRRLADGRRRHRRHGSPHRRRGRARLRRALGSTSRSGTARGHVAPPNRVAALFWGTVAGFTSFVAHVGGPPFQVYTLPLRLDPEGADRHRRRSSSRSPTR